MYIARLFQKGKLGGGGKAVRRLRAAERLLHDYEKSEFVPRVNCALNQVRGGKPCDMPADILTGTDRYVRVMRKLGDLFYTARFFVIEDKTATDWLACRGVFNPSTKRICGVYQAVCFALDAVADAYDEMREEKK